MKLQVVEICGQSQMFTVYKNGNPETVRLNSRESVTIETDEIPKDVRLAEEMGLVMVSIENAKNEPPKKNEKKEG